MKKDSIVGKEMKWMKEYLINLKSMYKKSRANNSKISDLVNYENAVKHFHDEGYIIYFNQFTREPIKIAIEVS